MEVALFAGEASGDLHGALLAKEIAHLSPGVRFWGLGGEKMRAEGVETLEPIERLAVLGFAEVALKIPFFLALERRIARMLARRRPAAAVMVDYPGLNLRLAGAARRSGVPVAYYIAPQVWAWGEGRVETIRRCVDRMIVILPFEEEFFAERGVAATFVGHPLLDVARPGPDHPGFRAALGVPAGVPLVGLLPGSRAQEVRVHLPLFLEALRIARERGVACAGVVGRAPTVAPALVASAEAVTDATYDLMAAADLLLVASGTATLEAALFGVPMVVVYKTSALSYRIGRRVVRVPHIALANLVAGARVVPELIQDAATPERIAGEMIPLLTDAGRRDDVRRALGRVRARLGEPGAARRAAEIVTSLARGAGVP